MVYFSPFWDGSQRFILSPRCWTFLGYTWWCRHFHAFSWFEAWHPSSTHHSWGTTLIPTSPASQAMSTCEPSSSINRWTQNPGCSCAPYPDKWVPYRFQWFSSFSEPFLEMLKSWATAEVGLKRWRMTMRNSITRCWESWFVSKDFVGLIFGVFNYGNFGHLDHSVKPLVKRLAMLLAIPSEIHMETTEAPRSTISLRFGRSKHLRTDPVRDVTNQKARNHWLQKEQHLAINMEKCNIAKQHPTGFSLRTAGDSTTSLGGQGCMQYHLYTKPWNSRCEPVFQWYAPMISYDFLRFLMISWYFWFSSFQEGSTCCCSCWHFCWFW